MSWEHAVYVITFKHLKMCAVRIQQFNSEQCEDLSYLGETEVGNKKDSH